MQPLPGLADAADSNFNASGNSVWRDVESLWRENRSMSRKKLLIVMNTMVCGGIETSGLAFLNALTPDRFEVTLLLVERTG